MKNNNVTLWTMLCLLLFSYSIQAQGLTNISTLAAFMSTNFNGTWNLHVCDDSGGDVGTVDSWSLSFSSSCASPSLTSAGDNVTVDFTGFTGSGFSPNPTSGQLCSNAWVVTGLSEGDGTIGGTHTSGDFARGSTMNGGVGTAGVYSLDNGAMWLQPAGSDLTPGRVYLRVKNETGSAITSVDIAYDLLYRNDQGRANSFNFAWAIDNDDTSIPVSFTGVAALDFTSPEGADNLGNQTENKSTTLSGLNWPAGDVLYLCWELDDVSGGGSRDEFGLDNVSVSLPNPSMRAPLTDQHR